MLMVNWVTTPVFLSPTFNRERLRKVAAADADLIVGPVLYDIKFTRFLSNMKNLRLWLAQLIGYVRLGEDTYDIEREGLLLIQQQTGLTADWFQISSLCDMRGLRSLILPEELNDKHTSG